MQEPLVWFAFGEANHITFTKLTFPSLKSNLIFELIFLANILIIHHYNIWRQIGLLCLTSRFKFFQREVKLQSSNSSSRTGRIKTKVRDLGKCLSQRELLGSSKSHLMPPNSMNPSTWLLNITWWITGQETHRWQTIPVVEQYLQYCCNIWLNLLNNMICGFVPLLSSC